MPNPIAFYKEIFLHVIPVRITVPWFTLTFSTFFSVSPMCSSSHKHLPFFITQEGCGFLLLTVNCDFTFCNPITGQCLELVNASNFLIDFLEAFSFSSPYVFQPKYTLTQEPVTFCRASMFLYFFVNLSLKCSYSGSYSCSNKLQFLYLAITSHLAC